MWFDINFLFKLPLKIFVIAAGVCVCTRKREREVEKWEKWELTNDSSSKTGHIFVQLELKSISKGM